MSSLSISSNLGQTCNNLNLGPSTLTKYENSITREKIAVLTFLNGDRQIDKILVFCKLGFKTPFEAFASWKFLNEDKYTRTFEVQTRTGKKIMSKIAKTAKDNKVLVREHRILTHINSNKLIQSFGISQSTSTCFSFQEMFNCSLLQYLEQANTNKELIAATLSSGIKIFSCLSMLDEHQIIHRNINPNTVILSKGQLKIRTLVFAKVLPQGTRLTREIYEGTDPEYLAPEIVKKTWYGKKADVWSASYLLYKGVVKQLTLNNRNIQNGQNDFDLLVFHQMNKVLKSGQEQSSTRPKARKIMDDLKNIQLRAFLATSQCKKFGELV